MKLNLAIIKSNAQDIFPKICEYRRAIHQNPELSFEEYNTSAFIKAKLGELNIPYQVYAGTGVAGLIGSGGKCVALRADMDALPVAEETGLEFAAHNQGVMHACGHDMHMAMLLGAAEILKEYEGELNGQVKLIFQPGEEKLPGGAGLMIKEGVLNNPAPDVIFGQHVNPGEKTGTIGLAAGPVMGSADELYITLSGKGSHAAQPHTGNDPVLAAAQLINHYQNLLTKFRNPLHPGVLTITSVHGGHAPNIIPDEVKMMGTMRSYNEEWRQEMYGLITDNSKRVCDNFGVDCKIDIVKGYPALINDKQATAFVNDIASDLLGEENIIEFEPKMWAEDFAYFAQKIPAVFWFLGVRPEDLGEMPPLHNSALAPDESAMINGMSLFAAAAVGYLGR